MSDVNNSDIYESVLLFNGSTLKHVIDLFMESSEGKKITSERILKLVENVNQCSVHLLLKGDRGQFDGTICTRADGSQIDHNTQILVCDNNQGSKRI